MKWIFYRCRDIDGGKNTFVVFGVLFVTHEEEYFGQLVATLILQGPKGYSPMLVTIFVFSRCQFHVMENSKLL